MMSQDMSKAKGEQEGPILTDQGGELDTPVLMCAYQTHRCKHLGVHDSHYFYCAAQDAPNKHALEGGYAYPWRGAGKQLSSYNPDEGCPFLPKPETSKCEETLGRYAVKGFTYSSYGYVIQPDGTIWSMASKWTHGVILALLYPEDAVKYGYGVPDREANVFHFQRFELEASYHLNCVRVAVNGMLVEWTVSKGNAPITDAQRRSLREIFKEHDVKWGDTIVTNLGDLNQVRLLELLKVETTYESRAKDAPDSEGLAKTAEKGDDNESW